MGAGVAQIVALLVSTVIGLPLFFFALMSALDRFEQALPHAGAATAQLAQAIAEPVEPAAEPADVVLLQPNPVTVIMPATGPHAAAV